LAIASIGQATHVLVSRRAKQRRSASPRSVLIVKAISGSPVIAVLGIQIEFHAWEVPAACSFCGPGGGRVELERTDIAALATLIAVGSYVRVALVPTVTPPVRSAHTGGLNEAATVAIQGRALFEN
jgi:hypothetical protein